MIEDYIRLEENSGIYDVKYTVTDEEICKLMADENEAELLELNEDFSSPDYELFLEGIESILRQEFDTDNYYRLVEQVSNYARY